MTERGLPIVDGAPACPFVAFDDARDDRSDGPDPRHRCFAENPPAPRARAHQEAYCLSSAFPICPTFQDWARREAARVIASTGADAAPVRLPDDSPQRPAGRIDAPMAAGGSNSSRSDDLAARHLSATGGPSAADRPQRRSSQFDWSAPPPWIAGGAQPEPAGSGRSGGSGEPAQNRANGGSGVAGSKVMPPAAGQKAATPTGQRPPPPASAAARSGGAEVDINAPGFLMAAGSDDGDGIGSAVGPGFAEGGGEPFTSRRPPAAPPAQRELPARRQRRATTAAEGLGAAAEGPSAAADARGPAVSVAASRPAERFGVGPNGGWIEPLDDEEEPQYEAPGLATLLGLDRRPRVGATRPVRQPERRTAEPAWERPRRYEAYPSLRTRVGLPVPSRLFLSAGALVVAALALFFIPPLFIRESGGATGPEATSSPSVAASSLAASLAPTPVPTPKQRTYTVRQGDVLSTIATRFGLTVDQILAANKQIKNPDKIVIGDVIVIPSPVPSEIVDGTVSSSP